jgi:hypothetical protein
LVVKGGDGPVRVLTKIIPEPGVSQSSKEKLRSGFPQNGEIIQLIRKRLASFEQVHVSLEIEPKIRRRIQNTSQSQGHFRGYRSLPIDKLVHGKSGYIHRLR